MRTIDAMMALNAHVSHFVPRAIQDSQLLEVANIQETNGKHRSCHKLLLERHLQPCNTKHRDSEYHHVGGEIQRRGSGLADGRFNAMAFNLWMINFLPRCAGEHKSEEQRKIQQEVGHDQYVDDHVKMAAAVVDEEYGLDLVQQYVFDREHGGAIHHLRDIFVLSWHWLVS